MSHLCYFIFLISILGETSETKLILHTTENFLWNYNKMSLWESNSFKLIYSLCTKKWTARVLGEGRWCGRKGLLQDVKLQCGWKWICTQTCLCGIMSLIIFTFSLSCSFYSEKNSWVRMAWYFDLTHFFHDTELKPKVVKITSTSHSLNHLVLSLRSNWVTSLSSLHISKSIFSFSES